VPTIDCGTQPTDMRAASLNVVSKTNEFEFSSTSIGEESFSIRSTYSVFADCSLLVMKFRFHLRGLHFGRPLHLGSNSFGQARSQDLEQM
jgi:hypothetical protein